MRRYGNTGIFEVSGLAEQAKLLDFYRPLVQFMDVTNDPNIPAAIRSDIQKHKQLALFIPDPVLPTGRIYKPVVKQPETSGLQETQAMQKNITAIQTDQLTTTIGEVNKLFKIAYVVFWQLGAYRTTKDTTNLKTIYLKKKFNDGTSGGSYEIHLQEIVNNANDDFIIVVPARANNLAYGGKLDEFVISISATAGTPIADIQLFAMTL